MSDERRGPTRREIKEEFERIRKSKRFKKAATSLRLLRLLIAANLRKRSLSEDLIGIKVFRRRKGWTPVLDSIVRVGRHNLQTYLLEYYAAEGAANPLVIHVPDGGSYRVTITYNPKSLAETACAAGMSKLPELFLNGPNDIRWITTESDQAFCGGERINPEADFEEALRSDPSHVPAFVGRAEARLVRAFLWDGIAVDHIRAAASDITVVFRLTEDYWPAYATLGGICCCQCRWKGAALIFDQLISAVPMVRNNSFWYIWFLLGENRVDEALQLTSDRVAADPGDPIAATVYGFVLYMTRRFDLAETTLRQAVTMRQNAGKGNYLAFFLLGCVCLALERHEEALALFLQCSTQWFLCGFLSVAHANKGDHKTAQELAAIFRTYGTFTLYRPAMQEALAYMATGNHEDAIHTLSIARTYGDPWIACIPFWPILDPLRTHENFRSLLESLRHVPDHWRSWPFVVDYRTGPV